MSGDLTRRLKGRLMQSNLRVGSVLTVRHHTLGVVAATVADISSVQSGGWFVLRLELEGAQIGHCVARADELAEPKYAR